MVSDGLLNSLHSFQPAVLGKPLTIIQAISMENIVSEIEVFQEETQGILVANDGCRTAKTTTSGNLE